MIVFRSSFEVGGRFASPSFADWKIAEDDVQWNEASLMTSITDLRGANQTLWLEWGDERIPLVPGGSALNLGPVVHARVPGLSGKSEAPKFQVARNVNWSGKTAHAQDCFDPKKQPAHITQKCLEKPDE